MYLGKRLISLISSVLIASLIFTGCGSNLSQSVLSKGILTKEQKIYEEPGSNAEELNIEAIMKWIKDSSEVKNKNAVTDGVKLDNDIKKLELEIKKAKWTEEKIEKAKRANQRIENSANNLRVDQEAASRVINPNNTNIRTNDE